jgi:hypothetical protein
VGRRPGVLAAVSLIAALALRSGAGERSPTAPLPPEIPWEGKSLSLIADAGDPWITPAEKSGFARSPSYDETLEWLRGLIAASPELRLVSLGTSPEGRPIWMVVASREHAFRHQTIHAAGKPTLLVQAGIHAGEIDGKDAGLMLLRDLTARGTKRELLDHANLLFVPILNVDGHERSSRFGRVNQRGPEMTGWRTNARNLNLNRDYAKLDAPETRAIVRALREWDPDLYLDVHVTDGFDYQYDVTFSSNGPGGYSPAIAGWLQGKLFPALTADLTAMGHVPGTLVWPATEEHLEDGLTPFIATPRLAHGYGDARHLASVLVETHSLKPYRRRVLGTCVLLESALALLGREFEGVRAARAADRARRPETLPLTWKLEPAPEAAEFAGISSREVASPVSGTTRTEWTGSPVTLRLPLFRQGAPLTSAARPKAYWVPAAWTDVIERLALHGIALDLNTEPREVDVEMLRLVKPRLASEFHEGHVSLSSEFVAERRRERFATGSARVPTDQPLGDLAVLLLDPSSPDSFFRWGFFNEILDRTEYVEGYILDPMAERMMAEDPALRAEFERRLREDPAFAADPKERRRFFYERTPYYDDRYLLYPVATE